MIEKYVTCGTVGCDSYGAQIHITYPEHVDGVLCGVCGNLITDVSDAPSEPVTEVPEWLQ